MKDCLLSFDYLSVKPSVYFKDKQKYSTWTDFIFSFFIGIAIFVLGIFFLRECTDKVTYFLTSTEEFVASDNADLVSVGFDILFDIRNGWGEQFPEFERYFLLKPLE